MSQASLGRRQGSDKVLLFDYSNNVSIIFNVLAGTPDCRCGSTIVQGGGEELQDGLGQEETAGEGQGKDNKLKDGVDFAHHGGADGGRGSGGIEKAREGARMRKHSPSHPNARNNQGKISRQKQEHQPAGYKTLPQQSSRKDAHKNLVANGI